MRRKFIEAFTPYNNELQTNLTYLVYVKKTAISSKGENLKKARA